ncbi:hypothetical protein ACQPZ8_27765 [Actinomadura nitritigenes]|uniref:hypothetical protein n=1 Tax=Actinomadura nitritigenes TaxID=134602 RepID=UPI003D8EB987
MVIAWAVMMAGACVAGQAWRGESLVTGAVFSLMLAAMVTALSVVVERDEQAGRRRREADALRRMVYGDEKPPEMPM